MNHASLILVAGAIGVAGFGAGFFVSGTLDTTKGDSTEGQAAITLIDLPEDDGLTIEVIPEDSEEERAYFLTLAAKDPITAEAEAMEKDDPREAIEWIAQARAATDPDGAYQWATEITNMELRSYAYRGIINALVAKSDIETATAFLDRMPTGRLRDFSAFPLIEAVATSDPATAVTIGESLAREWSVREAGEVIAEAHATPGKEEAFWELLESTDSDSFRRALAINFVLKVAGDDPERAIKVVTENSDAFGGGNPRWIYGEIAEEFGEENPEKGLEIAASIDNPELREEFLEELGERWGETFGKDSALTLVDRLNTTPDKNLETTLSGALDRLMENDQESVFGIINVIENPEVRGRLNSRAIGSLTRRNPQLASEKLEPLIEQGAPESAGITSRLMRSWMYNNPGDASRWLDQQSSGPAKDEGIEALVDNLLRVDQDYRGALAWTEQMQNPDKKARLTERVSRQIERESNP